VPILSSFSLCLCRSITGCFLAVIQQRPRLSPSVCAEAVQVTFFRQPSSSSRLPSGGLIRVQPSSSGRASLSPSVCAEVGPITFRQASSSSCASFLLFVSLSVQEHYRLLPGSHPAAAAPLSLPLSMQRQYRLPSSGSHLAAADCLPADLFVCSHPAAAALLSLPRSVQR
jgi:hypothetical protein